MGAVLRRIGGFLLKYGPDLVLGFLERRRARREAKMTPEEKELRAAQTREFYQGWLE